MVKMHQNSFGGRAPPVRPDPLGETLRAKTSSDRRPLYATEYIYSEHWYSVDVSVHWSSAMRMATTLAMSREVYRQTLLVCSCCSNYVRGTSFSNVQNSGRRRRRFRIHTEVRCVGGAGEG